MKEKIVLTFGIEDANAIVYGDHEDFNVIDEIIDSVHRCSYFTTVIVQQISTGNYFTSHYSQGSTEMIDHHPYEYDEPVFTQVFPVEKTIIVYE